MRSLIRCFQYWFSNNSNFIKTSVFKKMYWTNKRRWVKKENIHESWNKRTLLLANEIKEGSRVLEFGSGNLILKENLPKNCTYLNSDIVKRDEETIIIDLNKKIPPLPNVDFIIFSGVLEYVFNVEYVLNECLKYSKNILFSYATLDNFPNIKNRRINGWVSDLAMEDFYQILNKKDLNLEVLGNWKGQQLLIIKKK